VVFDKVGEWLWDCGEETGARRRDSSYAGCWKEAGERPIITFVACAHSPRFTYHDEKDWTQQGLSDSVL
jgi:hypothetical protein